MLNKKDYIIYVVLLIVGSVTLYNFISKVDKDTSDKTVYVDVKKVFENFQMKIELQKKLENETLSHRNYLDSMMFNIQLLKNKLENKNKPTNEEIKQYNNTQSIYFDHKQEIENRIGEMTAKYDAQIIEQMTQYISDFGKINQYDLIIGKNESGNLLYGNIKRDITKEVTQFINDKYQGN